MKEQETYGVEEFPSRELGLTLAQLSSPTSFAMLTGSVSWLIPPRLFSRQLGTYAYNLRVEGTRKLFYRTIYYSMIFFSSLFYKKNRLGGCFEELPEMVDKISRHINNEASNAINQ